MHICPSGYANIEYEYIPIALFAQYMKFCVNECNARY